MDSEGKVNRRWRKGKDAGTVGTDNCGRRRNWRDCPRGERTCIVRGDRGGAGLAAVTLDPRAGGGTARGSTLDVVLEHDLFLEGSQIPI